MIVALPALEVSRNWVIPPIVPAAVPPLLVIVALPAVDASKKPVKPDSTSIPSLAVIAAGVGVGMTPPLLVIVALPAVEVVKNSVRRRMECH